MSDDMVGPLPGELVDDRIVVASDCYREADPREYLVLLLNHRGVDPFYTVGWWRESNRHRIVGAVDHIDIVEAAEDYGSRR